MTPKKHIRKTNQIKLSERPKRIHPNPEIYGKYESSEYTTIMLYEVFRREHIVCMYIYTIFTSSSFGLVRWSVFVEFFDRK